MNDSSGRALRASVAVVTFSIECPRCREAVPEPRSGSLFWSVTEVDDVVVCACGARLRLPQRVRLAVTSG